MYLYAVVRADRAEALASGALRGVEGGAVRAIVAGEIAAAVGDVPSEAFDEGPLNDNVRDPAWLEPRAAAHHRVNAALLQEAGAVLPLAFGTIYRDEEGIRRLLRERSAELAERLQAVSGRAEWVVSLQRDRERAAAAVERESEALDARRREAGAAPPGRGYLMTKQLEDVKASELRARDREAAVAADAALRMLSERAFEEPLVEGADLVARTTYAAPLAKEKDFAAAIGAFNAAWRERGYELRATGPWPPYRAGAMP